MYGNLQEIDLHSLLYFFADHQKSGLLLIETKYDIFLGPTFYFILLHQGDIVFAGDENSFTLTRLKEYLNYYKLDKILQVISQELNQSHCLVEYETLLILTNKNHLSIPQQITIVTSLVKEILFQIINLKEGSFIWQENFSLHPLAFRFKLDKILPVIVQECYQWQTLATYYQSPQQCLLINNLKYKSLIHQELETILNHPIDGKTSLIQLSRFANKSIVDVAKLVYPYCQKNWLKVINKYALEKTQIYQKPYRKIVCISDDKNWLLDLEKILDRQQYIALNATNLNEGLNYIFNTTTNLVIFRSDVNRKDGEKLCKIMRSLTEYQYLPIILIAEHFNFQHYLKSRIYGANEYMSKNRFRKNIVNLLQKYVEGVKIV